MSPKQFTRRGSFGIILGVATVLRHTRATSRPTFNDFGRPVDVSGLAQGTG